MNILQYAKSVNPDSLKNNEIFDLQLAISQQMFYQQHPNEEIFELREFSEGVFYHALKIEDKDSKQANCSHNYAAQYAEIPLSPSENTKKIIDVAKKFPILKLSAEQGKEPLYFYKAYISEFLRTLRWISIQKNGQTFFIPQNQKGGTRYMKKVKWSIIDSCKEFDKLYKYCYFITLTIDPKKQNLNFLEWWKEFPKHRSKVLKKIQETYGGDYVWINEAQLNGRPHAHILWYTNYEFTDTKFNRKGKKKKQFIESGELFDFVHKWYTLGFIEMDINRRKNTYNYLTKYVVKSILKGWKVALKKSKRDKEDCKDILGLVCSIYSHTRMWGTSYGKYKKSESLSMENKSEFSTSLENKSAPTKEERSLAAEIPLVEGVSYLKTLSNNFLPPCVNTIGFYTEATMGKIFKGKEELANYLPEQRKALIHKEHAKAACRGCIAIKILNHYLGIETLSKENADNFELFFPMIVEKVEELERNEGLTEKYFDSEALFSICITSICRYLFGDGVIEKQLEQLRDILQSDWQLWILYKNADLRKKLFRLRLQRRLDLRDSKKYNKLFGIFHQKMHDALLTSSASGVII